MKIFVHDFAGHPFQVELSRQLARNGHQVMHGFCGTVQTGQGLLHRVDDDPTTFETREFRTTSEIRKYQFFHRAVQEYEYGGQVAQFISTWKPDVVICANTPIISLFAIQRSTRQHSARFIYWLQDVFGEGVSRVLKGKYLLLGSAVGFSFKWLEGRLLRRSDHVVAITSDFKPILDKYDVDPKETSVIHNWAPLGEISVQPRENNWGNHNRIFSTLNFIYAGTLGLKHDPQSIWQLAQSLRSIPEAQVIVVSEGMGANWLRTKLTANPDVPLTLLPFQPYSDLPFVLASADVLLVILEPDAGVFSVPSKVLSYLCAGRAIIGMMPKENIAARIVTESGAGIVVEPGDTQSFISAANSLRENSEGRNQMGKLAREYAERNFNIETITEQFERAIAQ